MASTLGPEKLEQCARAWPVILDDIRNASRVDHACAKHGLQRQDLWLYRQGKPELVAAWYDAMKDSADAYVDRIEETIANAGNDAKAARVQLAALQWIAEKRDPDKYGQRTRADINVKTVDLTAIIRDANARLAAAQQGRVIEHSPNNSVIGDIRAHAQSAIDPALLALIGAPGTQT